MPAAHLRLLEELLLEYGVRHARPANVRALRQILVAVRHSLAAAYLREEKTCSASN